MARNVGRTLLSACLFGGTLIFAGQAHAAGSVVLYTADGLEDFYKEVLPAFESKEGVKVAIVTAGSGEVVNRATVEKDSPKGDVLVTLPPFIQQAASTGVLAKYKSPEYAHVAKISKAADGSWATFMNNYFCFAVNQQEVPNPPKTFADLLKPEYQGKIAYSNPQTAGDGMAVVILTTAAMGSEDKAFSFLKKLEPAVKFHTKGTGYLDVLLSRQEITVANGDLQMDADDANNGGLTLQPIFLAPKEGAAPVTFQLPYAIGLINKGPNGDEGKKLIDYLMSKDVQSKVADSFGLTARDDVKPTGKNADYLAKVTAGVKVLPVDWDKVAAKQSDWEKRWRSEVVGNATKQLAVVKPAQ